MHIIFFKLFTLCTVFVWISLYVTILHKFQKTARYLNMLHFVAYKFQKTAFSNEFIYFDIKHKRNKIAKLISFNIVGIGISLLICHLQLHVLKPRINWQLQYWKTPQTFQHGKGVYARMDIHREG